MVVPVLQIVGAALKGLSVYSPGEPIKAADATDVLEQLNLVLDDWSAETQASYAETFTTFVTTPGLQPHTIGPTGTWTMPARPVSIDAVSLGIGSGLFQRLRLSMDPAWWNDQTSVLSGNVFGAFYSPDEPNGSLYFTGIPDSASSIRLMMRTTLGPVALTDVMTLPQGYQSALELTLMEAIADHFHATLTPQQTWRAGRARGRIFGNNLRVPSLRASRSGAPGTGSRHYDYRTGQWF